MSGFLCSNESKLENVGSIHVHVDNRELSIILYVCTQRTMTTYEHTITQHHKTSQDITRHNTTSQDITQHHITSHYIK